MSKSDLEKDGCSECNPETCAECGNPLTDEDYEEDTFDRNPQRVQIIVNSQPAPHGWTACYLLDEDNEYSIAMLPVALWVTVEFESPTNPDIMLQEIRHFVATPEGLIMDYEDINDRFICVTPPDDANPAETALKMLLQTNDIKPEDLISVTSKDDGTLS